MTALTTKNVLTFLKIKNMKFNFKGKGTHYISQSPSGAPKQKSRVLQRKEMLAQTQEGEPCQDLTWGPDETQEPKVEKKSILKPRVRRYWGQSLPKCQSKQTNKQTKEFRDESPKQFTRTLSPRDIVVPGHGQWDLALVHHFLDLSVQETLHTLCWIISVNDPYFSPGESFIKC